MKKIKLIASCFGFLFLFSAVIISVNAWKAEDITRLEKKLAESVRLENATSATVADLMRQTNIATAGLAVKQSETFQAHCILISAKINLGLPIADTRFVDICKRADLQEYLKAKQAKLPVSQKNEGKVTAWNVSPEKTNKIAMAGEQNGIYPADLLALCIKESGCRDEAVGDNGRARGAFQITDPSLNNPHDFDKSLAWTISDLKKHGYKQDDFQARKFAIWRHNGYVPGVNDYYPTSVLKISDQIHKDPSLFAKL